MQMQMGGYRTMQVTRTLQKQLCPMCGGRRFIFVPGGGPAVGCLMWPLGLPPFVWFTAMFWPCPNCKGKGYFTV